MLKQKAEVTFHLKAEKTRGCQNREIFTRKRKLEDHPHGDSLIIQLY